MVDHSEMRGLNANQVIGNQPVTRAKKRRTKKRGQDRLLIRRRLPSRGHPFVTSNDFDRQVAIDATDDRLVFPSGIPATQSPLLIQGLRAKYFQTTRRPLEHRVGDKLLPANPPENSLPPGR